MTTDAGSRENHLIESVLLSDGVVLKILDRSKKIAGDRWQVRLTTRLEIPVEAICKEAAPELPPADELRAALGDPVIYEHDNTRQFVDEAEKPRVLEMLRETFRQQVQAYIATPGFHQKYAARQYQEIMKRKTWYPDDGPSANQGDPSDNG